MLYVLDEPSVGLHARDVARLTGLLRELRDKGNTVLVVEHDADVIAAADHVVDLGPGAGTHGGEIVFEGTSRDPWQVGRAGVLEAGHERLRPAGYPEEAARRQGQMAEGPRHPRPSVPPPRCPGHGRQETDTHRPRIPRSRRLSGRRPPPFVPHRASGRSR